MLERELGCSDPVTYKMNRLRIPRAISGYMIPSRSKTTGKQGPRCCFGNGDGVRGEVMPLSDKLVSVFHSMLPDGSTQLANMHWPHYQFSGSANDTVA